MNKNNFLDGFVNMRVEQIFVTASGMAKEIFSWGQSNMFQVSLSLIHCHQLSLYSFAGFITSCLDLLFELSLYECYSNISATTDTVTYVACSCTESLSRVSIRSVFVLLASPFYFACLLICFSAELKNRQVTSSSRPFSMIDDSM